MEIDNRKYGKYYLNDCGVNNNSYQKECKSCDLCELTDLCDRLVDDLNDIFYGMCISKGVIRDTEYKYKYPDAYFKEIEEIDK